MILDVAARLETPIAAAFDALARGATPAVMDVNQVLRRWTGARLEALAREIDRRTLEKGAPFRGFSAIEACRAWLDLEDWADASVRALVQSGRRWLWWFTDAELESLAAEAIGPADDTGRGGGLQAPSNGQRSEDGPSPAAQAAPA